LAKYKNFGEIEGLIKEARSIRAGDYIEPETPLTKGQHLIGTVAETDVKQLHTIMMQRVNRLNDLKEQVEQAGGPENVPETTLEDGQQAMFELDLIREMFFLTLFKRYAADDAEGVGIAAGWQVYWQKPQPQQFNLPPGMVMIDPSMFGNDD